MTLFHWMQISLASVAVLLFAGRFYRLAIRSAVDTRAFLDVLADCWIEAREQVAALLASHRKAAVATLCS